MDDPSVHVSLTFRPSEAAAAARQVLAQATEPEWRALVTFALQMVMLQEQIAAVMSTVETRQTATGLVLQSAVVAPKE